MSEYRAVNRTLSHGDTVALGNLKRKHVSARGGDARLQGVEAGDRDDYVVLSKDLSDSEPVSVPDSAVVLGIVERSNNAASLWVAVPREAYQ